MLFEHERITSFFAMLLRMDPFHFDSNDIILDLINGFFHPHSKLQIVVNILEEKNDDVPEISTIHHLQN